MRMLLDTHAFLWFVLGDSRCSQIARSQIENGANQLYLSPASHWELAIKISIGKYKLPISFQDFILRAVHENGFRFLPIDPAHTSLLTTMPFHHRDPFDRLMIAQALVEQMQIISSDTILDDYSVIRVW